MENTNDLVIVPDLDMNSKVAREPGYFAFPTDALPRHAEQLVNWIKRN